MIKRRKTIKNRIASLIMASVMVYSLIPVNAIAANHEHNAECGYDISGECTYNQDAAATAAETDDYEYLTSAKSAALTIIGGTAGTDYSYENGVLDIKTAGTYEIKNTVPDTPTADAIVVSAAEGTVNITLSGVNIKTNDKAAFQITGNCETNIILKNGTDNTLDSSGAKTENDSGIFAGLQNDTRILSISCDNINTENHTCEKNTCGKLNAYGGGFAAGIGGGNKIAAGNITIYGGIIYAGSSKGAGIGGGLISSATNITISGGTVTATSEDGAGIGGGFQGDGNNITISGGSVTAESMSDGAGAGIGGGDKGNGSNIIISGGTVYAKSEQGAGIGGGLEGSGSYITIYDGTVNAESMSGAGIGGGDNGSGSNITISSGIVTAKSSHGAGIGGGNKGNGSDITISGGTVNAESQSGAGIGGSQNGNVNNIIISGGTVNATSTNGAGIGGGPGGAPDKYNSDIIISGGTVTAESEYGAGIGGGQNSNVNNITISGGTVTAKSMSGAGIGGGDKGNGSDITIYDGTVNAESDYGAGIGGGYKGNGSDITIYGGTVTAGSMSDVVDAGIGSVGAGIGGGCQGNGSYITIYGGKVTAESMSGAGIGGGDKGTGGGDTGNGSNIIISGGTVTAKSMYGAGIGGGDKGNGSNITLAGGTVTATSTNGTGIGRGSGGSAANIKIAPLNPTKICAYNGSDSNGTALAGSPFTSETDITDLLSNTFYCETPPYLIITGGTSGTDYIYQNSILNIIKAGTYKIKNSEPSKVTSDIIKVSAPSGTVNITFAGVNIVTTQDMSVPAFEITGDCLTNIILADNTNNILNSWASKYGAYNGYAGLQNGEKHLSISCQHSGEEGHICQDTCGFLTAVGGNYAACIGGSFNMHSAHGMHGSNITINGGNITAKNEGYAGIGGSYKGNGENITITGGNVTAASIYGAGIGGGEYGNGSNITISGGTVNATSTKGAGIGGGDTGNGSYITIAGGTVNAESEDGAGIGGGEDRDGTHIIILGGTVTATSETGAGIGGGENGTALHIEVDPVANQEIVVNSGADVAESQEQTFTFPRRTDITELIGSHAYFHSNTIGDHSHSDIDKDHICDNNCDAFIGYCQDADKDHDCDYGCRKYFGAHEDSNTDHICDYGCAAAIEAHTAASGKHICGYCGKAVTFCTDFAEAVKPEALKSAADCTNSAVYYKSCTICGANGTETFTDGEALGHTYSSGRCTRCSASDPGYIKPSDVPQTGDNSNIAVWFALLFISGGAVIVLTDIERKKNIQNK